MRQHIGLKVRFTVFFSIMCLFLLTVFSFFVYFKVKEQLLAQANQTLVSFLEHEAQHLEVPHRELQSHLTGQPREIHLRIEKNGTKILDSIDPKSPSLLTKKLSRVESGNQFTLTAAFDMTSTQAYLSSLRNVLLLGCLGILFLIVPFAFWCSRVLLKPFRVLAENTRQITVERLSTRFAEPRAIDEYGLLVRNFNSLLGRLENAFGNLQRFALNVSHEFRTPVSVIIAQSEAALRKPREVAAYEEALRKILGKARSLDAKATHLLFIADIERLAKEGVRSEVNVSRRLGEIVEALQLRNPQKNVEIDTQEPELLYSGSDELFNTIASNLVENAYQFSHGSISIKAGQQDRFFVLYVEDDGPGVPIEDRDKIFEPFHTTRKNGHGLGLSLVRAAVGAVQGTVAIGTAAMGGLRVCVRLPN